MTTRRTANPWFSLSQKRGALNRLAAVAEPGFVLIAGTLVAGVALAHLGVAGADHYLYDAPTPDFRSAAAVQLVHLTVRYGIVFAIALLLGFVRGRSTAASYGLTPGTRSPAYLLGTGILLGLIAFLPGQLFRLVNEYKGLGPGTPFWALEARVPWNTAFWLYMAVGSYLVVPLVEEFFTRGYLLGRVRESFSAGGSLLLASVFFTVAHGQYRHTDILAIGAQISLLLWAAIAAYSVMRTASLVPAIIAHAIINVPMTVTVRWIMLVVSLIALAVWREAVVSWTKGMITTLRQIDDWLPTILALIAIVLLLTTIAMTQWIVYVYVTVLGMLALLGIRQRSAWSAVIEPITRG